MRRSINVAMIDVNGGAMKLYRSRTLGETLENLFLIFFELIFEEARRNRFHSSPIHRESAIERERERRAVFNETNTKIHVGIGQKGYRGFHWGGF